MDETKSQAIDALFETLWPQIAAAGEKLNQMFVEAELEVDTASVIALLQIWADSSKRVGMDKESAMDLLNKVFDGPGPSAEIGEA